MLLLTDSLFVCLFVNKRLNLMFLAVEVGNLLHVLVKEFEQ